MHCRTLSDSVHHVHASHTCHLAALARIRLERGEPLRTARVIAAARRSDALWPISLLG